MQVCMCVCVDRDTEVEACQRFFRDGLTLSFNRILTHKAVATWKADIQVHVYMYMYYNVHVHVYTCSSCTLPYNCGI